MKLSKLILATILIIGFQTSGNSQFYKRFSVEFGVNRSIVINTKPIQNHHIQNANRSSDVSSDRSEAPSYSNNYSMSVGFRIAKNHHVRVRRSFNNFGSHITGIFQPHYTGFCGVGMPGPTSYQNARNLITSASLGGLYEFQIPISEGSFSFELGAEKHWYSYDDSFVSLTGYSNDSYSVYSSVGFIAPLYKGVQLHPKFFFTKSVVQNIGYEIDDQYENYIAEYGGEYVPLQIGFELGLRFDLQSF